MARALTRPALGPDYQVVNDFLSSLTGEQSDGLLTYFGLDPVTDGLDQIVDVVARTIENGPTIVWVTADSEWKLLSEVV